MHLPFSVDVKRINTSTVANMWRPTPRSRPLNWFGCDCLWDLNDARERERDCCDASLKRHPSLSAVWLLPLVETFCTEQISWAELPFRPRRRSHTVDSPPCLSPVMWNVGRKGGLNVSLPKTHKMFTDVDADCSAPSALYRVVLGFFCFL